MTCQELVELVTDYLEGALPREDVARFEAHLAACPGCQIHFEQIRTTIELTRGLVEPHELSPLLDAFRDWHRARSG